MDDEALLVHIREVLNEVLEEVDLSNLSPQTHLRDDLGVDSMMAVQMAYSLSQRFKKDMPFERWYTGQAESGNYTVRSLMDFLRQHLDH